MSRNYYFQKWRNLLEELDKLIHFDLFLQTSKSNEQLLCMSAFWLTGVLARYVVIYKEITSCLMNNVQIQKTEYYKAVSICVGNRISELRQQLSKLESSSNRFFANGLICHKMTPMDIEPNVFCSKTAESEQLEDIMKKVMERIEKRKEEELAELLLAQQAEQEEEAEKTKLWADDKAATEKHVVTDVYQTEKKISETKLERLRMITIIQAQERSRQVVKTLIQQKQKREIWVKELDGTLNPPSRLEIRERAAILIQMCARKYFELKRKSLLDCKRDEILGIQFCTQPKLHEHDCSDGEKVKTVFKTTTAYQKDLEDVRVKLKTRYVQSKLGQIKEDHGDFLRAWFYKWYKEAKFFFDVPEANKGGSTLILKDEVVEPYEWSEQYKEYIEQKNKNKNKSEYEKKAEKEAAKMEKKILKKLNQRSKIQKMNLAEFSGYDYPESKTIEDLQNAVEKYHSTWDEYDDADIFEAKEKFVPRLELINIITDIKQSICLEVDETMKEELKRLKNALKLDYENNEEPFPESMKTAKKKKNSKKKQKKVPAEIDEEVIISNLQEMVEKGFLKEYPKTYFHDFYGDHNFIGDEIRCLHRIAQPYAGELRHTWWERCERAGHEFQKILLLGPRGSGRTTLTRILATYNDAKLYEFDPVEIQKDPEFSASTLQEMVNTAVSSIKATQPAVVYIRHLQNLYQKKTPKHLKENVTLMQKNFIKKLCKFNKADRVTVIASCSDPWDAKMSKIEKRFQMIILTPDTSYSVASKMLMEWVTNNRVVPPDFPISALAYFLKGYEYRFLKETLDLYLSGKRLVSIPVRGLEPNDVYEFALETAKQFAADNITNHNQLPINDYNKYWAFYLEKTANGKKEMIHQKKESELAEQRRVLAEKEEKKRRAAEKKMKSAVSSMHTINNN